ncbi:PREDICTED: structure-specific endonuclease subunit SLX4 [Gekko japonicus]|uniref:Structure-specific endonuclease subunit SLX4 n=1 Tax=Gekko japonicus TaxID=146911 RepID=A0ABM1JVF7_GEKJA|nr:PREDICTED: structure-specific endonuclease subunit SLX4 [Gekko japonicus]
MGAAEEELLVAMAMSQSLHEEAEAAKARWLSSGRQNRARQGRKNPRGEKKSRVMPPQSPPTLLLQDPEEARRQTEERVALLLAEADEFPGTPPLAPSRLLASELSGRADWSVALPRGPPSSLWERSSLAGPSAPGPLCVAGSTLPDGLGQTDQRPMPSTALPLLGSERPEATGMLLRGRGRGTDLRGSRPREEEAAVVAEASSQEEGGALQDLMELAGEGLTLTQWNPAAQQEEEPEGMPGNVPQSHHLNQPLEEEKKKPPPLGSLTPPVLLGSLAAAFKGMVNNPHLSDVQFQVGSGELFYAHMFVLYARCPQLMEAVDQTGFWVAEEGEAKARRVLLSDVSGEAARVFLSYLYTAEHLVPQHVLSDVAALAVRFGVAELAALCAAHGWSEPPAADTSGREEEEEERVEQFEKLLKSIWVGEEEEDRALLPEEPGCENMVAEQELEEIYEFAATQRKAQEEEERHSRERPRGAEAEEGGLGPESSPLQGQEAGPSCPLEPPQDAPEQKPLGAASRRCPEGLPEPAEKSLLATSWGAESWELFPGSQSGREPSEDCVALLQSSTPLGPEPLSQSFSRGGSPVSLGVLAEELPASPQEKGGFPSDLSLPLFSPAPQEASGKPCRGEEQGLPEPQSVASAGRAASSGADNTGRAPAPLPSFSPPVVDPASERELGQGKWPAEGMGLPPEEREALGAVGGHLGREVDSGCCQGRRAPLLGTPPSSEGGDGGQRIRGPGAPLFSHGAPSGRQVAKLGLTSGPEAQWPGDAQGSGPTLKSALTPSPKRQSLQGWPPLGQRSPPPLSSACLPADGKSAANVVVILDDSEEEVEAAARPSVGDSSVLEVDLPVFEEDSGHLFHEASPKRLTAAKAGCCRMGSPPRPLLRRNGTPPGGSRTAGKEPSPRSGCPEEGSRGSDGSRSRRLDFWGQGAETEVLPLPRRLPVPVPVPKTPDLFCQEREALCTTPPTPMPSYSIMETPVLKKELSRFGVRTLPKQQMVLKLKEIFQYTHQRSDSRDAAASSQPGLCHGTQAALRSLTSAAARRGFPQQLPACPALPRVLLAGECFGGSSGGGDQGQMAKRGCLPAGAGRRKRAAEGPARSGQALAAFQKAGGLSGAASDMSVVLQSSSTEFETSVLAEEEEEEEDIPASQATCREAAAMVALRQYICSRPALRRQILFYQPFELARLQSELKQSGIRVALGRLLEFLDAHCITFTTAEARREKKQQQQGARWGRGRGKRY